MAPKRPPTTSPEKSSLQVTRRCHAVASLTKDPRMHTEQTNMSAPTQPAPSKPKPETKKGGGIANFIVNNENSVMSVEHQPGQTPFDNSGLLPQWKVESLKKTANKISGPCISFIEVSKSPLLSPAAVAYIGLPLRSFHHHIRTICLHFHCFTSIVV